MENDPKLVKQLLARSLQFTANLLLSPSSPARICALMRRGSRIFFLQDCKILERRHWSEEPTL